MSERLINLRGNEGERLLLLQCPICGKNWRRAYDRDEHTITDVRDHLRFECDGREERINEWIEKLVGDRDSPDIEAFNERVREVFFAEALNTDDDLDDHAGHLIEQRHTERQITSRQARAYDLGDNLYMDIKLLELSNLDYEPVVVEDDRCYCHTCSEWIGANYRGHGIKPNHPEYYPEPPADVPPLRERLDESAETAISTLLNDYPEIETFDTAKRLLDETLHRAVDDREAGQ